MTFCYSLLLIMFCNPPEPAPVVSDYCQITRYILWSARDTRATKEAADIHNRQRRALCEGVKGK